MTALLSRRSVLKAGGAMVIGLGPAGRALAQLAPEAEAALGKTLDLNEVDGFIAIHADGSVTLFCGKVDLGTGLRIAIPQMAAEELGIGLDRIAMVEGDSALTPNQGSTAGSTGIVRGGVQIRQAAATAREALIRMGAERLGRPAAELDATDGQIRPKAGGPGIGFGTLVGDRRFNLKLDAKAPLRTPASYKIVGQPIARPDVPAKVTGRHVYVHDFKLPGMLHARVIRTASVGAKLLEVDEASIRDIPGARIVRINDFLAVVAGDEWDAVRAMRALKVRWTESTTLIGHERVQDWMRAGPFMADEVLSKKGDAGASLAASGQKLSGTYYWPLQTHGSMGPSCSVADVRDGKATIWSASQGTHRLQQICARILDLQPANVRVVYLDGAGCYGMNGHDDASVDAAMISKAIGQPVRLQWMREDEHGWDPKGPPQLLSLEGGLDSDGRIAAWRTEMWLPRATANLPNPPLLGPEAANIPQMQGLSTGLITQNAEPPYAVPNVQVLVHWLKDSPLRPSNIRAPGKVANSFAVESFIDDLATAARRDPVAFRLDGLSDPRGIEVLTRMAALMGWQARPSPQGGGLGRGIAYVHYKFNETYVAIGMEAQVDRATGAIRVQRVACAHDCGLVINPDALRQQIEGNILQTLSRTLFEEVTFDRGHVTSVDWMSYPILTMPDVPELLIDVIDRPNEPPLGAGEAACAPVPAALANAIFDAVGARLRTVPFTPERVKAAIARGFA
ncbi:CO or xanthine dehydrogenase, Mo-binding subunit [Bosea sp. OK403]|uniref:xanthine dehydrogenase family protein molybdopterin-binding subunit n=1 Tax=Bosea sp. OK403 TaxID=1855286 RepID=UPI0008ED63B5|nr:molybdopterin cofactor-binding domain-containing protein [Bosea sp. OK403]SFI32786.1 CO or xanthine dehydrogenase, Mo-binding subunit [Bosea sp. OK403]